jgi:putative tricarboxylic transport membrane protein
MVRNTKDFWSGVIYIFFAVTAILMAREYGMGTAVRMGAAYFPTILGALLLLIGAISVVRGFLVPGTPIGAFAFKGLLAVIGGTVLFGLIVRDAGVAVALPLLAIVSAFGSMRFRWLPTLAMAAGLTLFCIFVFVKGLGIPLPIFGPWFGG